MEDYQQSSEIEVKAKAIIMEHHPHLENATIAYLMQMAKRDKHDNIVLPKLREGKARKLASACVVPPKYFALTGFDFLIVVKEEAWAFFDDRQRRALLDHELSHCLQDGNGYYVGDHDVQEFCSIVERHGPWKSDIARFAQAVQKALPFDAPKKQRRPVSPVDGADFDESTTGAVQ
jgi:hypothetical protein